MPPAAPLTAASAATGPSGAVPAMNSPAMAPWAAKATRSEPAITRWRGNRSASTPPASRDATSAAALLASTSPSSVAEPPGRPRIANASATGAIAVPSQEIAWAAKR
jgi:hypothetical protein